MNEEDYIFDSEFKEQKFVRRVVKPNDIVIDVGAHFGKYTKLFALLGCKVYAFEPVPQSFNKLSENSADFSNVKLFKNALMSFSGPAGMFIYEEPNSSWSGMGHPDMGEESSEITVDCITLDSFCYKNNIERIDYLKLDVEGAEINALEGMSDLLLTKSIRYLQFEISQKMLEGSNRTAKEVFDKLNEYGYACYEITPDGEFGIRVFDSNSFYENYIAVPI